MVQTPLVALLEGAEQTAHSARFTSLPLDLPWEAYAAKSSGHFHALCAEADLVQTLHDALLEGAEQTVQGSLPGLDLPLPGLPRIATPGPLIALPQPLRASHVQASFALKCAVHTSMQHPTQGKSHVALPLQLEGAHCCIACLPCLLIVLGKSSCQWGSSRRTQ